MVAKFLVEHDAKLLGKDGEMIDLNDSPLSLNVRIFGEFDPDWEVDPSNITIQEKLGEGEFGIVYKARWHGTPVAVKVLKDNSNVALGDFRTELNVLMKVHSPHCVSGAAGLVTVVPCCNARTAQHSSCLPYCIARCHEAATLASLMLCAT